MVIILGVIRVCNIFFFFSDLQAVKAHHRSTRLLPFLSAIRYFLRVIDSECSEVLEVHPSVISSAYPAVSYLLASSVVRLLL